MKKYAWILLLCFVACSKGKNESNAKPTVKGFPFEFVLEKPVLTIKDTEGVSFDKPITETVKVVSDTTKKALLIYFDKKVVYEAEDVIYGNEQGKTIEAEGRIVLTIMETDNKLLQDQIFITLENGKVISAKGDYHTN